MYRVIRSVLIFSLVAVFVGCEYWNKDMLGYLEYWSETVQMGRVDKSGAEFQKNNDGIDTIPVAATPTITAVLINPKGFGLDVTKGTSSGSSVIIDNANVANFVETPILSDNNTLLSVRLKPGDESLEHQTFTLTFEPVRTDNKLAVPGQSITLRYNTPPAAPMPVVKTETGYELVPSGAKWEASEGKLYWAYYDEQDEKKPNCAKYFKVGDNLKSLDECLDSNATISGSNYKVFYAQTGSASTSVAAVDSEGITGAAIVSGQVAPACITYDNPTNLDSKIEGTLPSPQYFEQGTLVTLANKGDLRRAGYTFVGWSENSDGSGQHYEANKSYTFNGDITLYSRWAPITEFYVSSSSGSDESFHDGSEQYPFKTIGKALHFINEINDGTQNFTINVVGTYTEEDADVDNNNNAVVNIVPDKTLNLTIQGKDGNTATIDAANLNTDGAKARVMYIGANAKVILQNITLTGGNFTTGGGVYIASDGSLTLKSGATISKNKATRADTSSENDAVVGGGVCNRGALTMETDSSIMENISNQFGGGVNNSGGTFNMNGGTISGNEAETQHGGGVYNSGSFTMTGGTISGNNANHWGGGVYTSTGTFNMSGGIISVNNANQGGGVYINDGSFTMSGGTISGNTAASGGGVYNFDGTFNMSGGIISVNNANRGGGVYNFDGTFNMSGSATVDSNNVVYLPSGKTITVGALTGDAETVATITPESYEGDADAAVQVLVGNTPENLTSFYTRFRVTPSSEYPYNWEINLDGTISGVPSTGG